MKIKQNSIRGISVFYAHKNIHTLLATCIYSIFETLSENNLIQGYIVHIAKEHGSHINVTYFICDTPGSTENVLKLHVSTFLESAPSKRVRERFPKEQIFRDFDNNTFCFNMFKLPAQHTQFVEQHELLQLRMALTKLICTNLCRKQLTEQNIFSFSLQLQLIMSRAIFGSKANARNEIANQIDLMIAALHSSHQQLIKSDAADIIRNNFTELMVLSDSIWLKKSGNSQFSEFDSWYELCEKLKNNRSHGAAVYMDICEIIVQHIDCPRQLFVISAIAITELLQY